jgi:hypothetical protein
MGQQAAGLEAKMVGLEAKVDRIDVKLTGEMLLIKWMLGSLLGGMLALLMRLFA